MTEQPRRGRIAHRVELDGLRGLSIALVLAAHVKLPGAPALGYVGVDVFFVLSGYLITSLLIAEHAATGRIDLWAFYARRIRRLAPALIALVVVVGALMAVIGQWTQYVDQALAALAYVANIAIADGQEMGFLQHTWSLSLEEQFYLLWPAVFLLVPRRWLAAAVLVAIAGSVAAHWTHGGDPFATVRSDVRAAAVLIGCLFALVPVRVPRWTSWLAMGAFAAVLLVPSPMYAMTLAAAGIVLVAEHVGVLRSRVLVRLGELSYGLYIWHFVPALLLMNRSAMGDVVAQATVILTSLALALASERWIERPFRRGREPSPDAVSRQVAITPAAAPLTP